MVFHVVLVLLNFFTQRFLKCRLLRRQPCANVRTTKPQYSNADERCVLFLWPEPFIQIQRKANPSRWSDHLKGTRRYIVATGTLSIHSLKGIFVCALNGVLLLVVECLTFLATKHLRSILNKINSTEIYAKPFWFS